MDSKSVSTARLACGLFSPVFGLLFGLILFYSYNTSSCHDSCISIRGENGAREYMRCENDLFLLMKNVQTRKSLKNEAKENDKCFSYGDQ